jgi:hypothetical protein
MPHNDKTFVDELMQQGLKNLGVPPTPAAAEPEMYEDELPAAFVEEQLRKLNSMRPEFEAQLAAERAENERRSSFCVWGSEEPDTNSTRAKRFYSQYSKRYRPDVFFGESFTAPPYAEEQRQELSLAEEVRELRKAVENLAYWIRPQMGDLITGAAAIEDYERLSHEKFDSNKIRNR